MRPLDKETSLQTKVFGDRASELADIVDLVVKSLLGV